MIDESQAKLVELTMKLNLKTKEFQQLCKKLDELKKLNIDPNDKRLLKVKKLFEEKYEEISNIKLEIDKLKIIN